VERALDALQLRAGCVKNPTGYGSAVMGEKWLSNDCWTAGSDYQTPDTAKPTLREFVV